MINDYMRKEPIEIYIYLWKNQKVKDHYFPVTQAIGQLPDNTQSRYKAVPKWGEWECNWDCFTTDPYQKATVTHTKILRGNKLVMQGNMV